MPAGLIRSQILKSKELILDEARNLHGFMDLMMKQRNTGNGWTRAEKAQLRSHIARMASYIPVLVVFLLPGGFLLIPLLAEALDRRKHRRGTTFENQGDSIEPTPQHSLKSTVP